MLSFKENIPIILGIADKMKPMSVLDIGAGMGKYGLLIREQYLSEKAEKGELEPSNNIVINAVEDTKYLIDKIDGKGIYNRIYKESIFDLVKNSSEKDFDYKYDLVLLIDVVEHWPKEDAFNLLKYLTHNVGPVLVSTPKRVGMYKEHFYGDPRHHISQYVLEDFKKDFIVQDYSNNLSHIIILCAI